jgi:hypothetical protein
MHGVVQVILADERICASRDVVGCVVNGQEDLGGAEAESARRTGSRRVKL